MLRLAAYAIGAIAPEDAALENEFIQRLALVRDDGPGRETRPPCIASACFR